MPDPDVVVAKRYRLVKQIAFGGMGSVWEAWDERLQRRVALKRLHAQHGLSPIEAKIAGDRAMREARITARLHHPHAVPVYDVVDFDGRPCLIMQYLPSQSLQALISERGVLSAGEVALLGGQLAGALAAAHRVGIVHRDVKPGNILIDHDGSAKITDFGISHAVGDVALTATGMVTGTPAFLAPEVARGVESSHASDVFSLGSTLYAALEGGPPFGTEENPMAMLHRVAAGEIIPPRRSGPLTRTLMLMLAVDPAARPSMQDVADQLSSVHAAIMDPAASGPTQRIDRTKRVTPSSALPHPPPTATVTLPAVNPSTPPTSRPAARPAAFSGSGRPDERRKRGLVAVSVAAVVLGLGLAAILAVHLLDGSSNSNSGAARGTPLTRSTPTTASSRPAARTTTAQARTTAATPSTPAQTQKAESAPPASSSISTSNGVAAGDITSSQLSGAVRNYYALLPDNTQEAWNRLTPEYQAQTGGRGAYEQFWKGFRSVTATNLHVNGGSVTADLRYVADDGSVSSEIRSFVLVRQDGILKIAQSQV